MFNFFFIKSKDREIILNKEYKYQNLKKDLKTIFQINYLPHYYQML